MKTRPTSMTIASILNLIFGGLGMTIAASTLITSSSMLNNQLSPAASRVSPQNTAIAADLGLKTGFLSFVVGGLAIVSGVGLIQVAKWSRAWTLGYAFTAIGSSLFFLISILIGIPSSHDKNAALASAAIILAPMVILKSTYPIILLILLRTQKWREVLSSNSTSA